MTISYPICFLFPSPFELSSQSATSSEVML